MSGNARDYAAIGYAAGEVFRPRQLPELLLASFIIFFATFYIGGTIYLMLAKGWTTFPLSLKIFLAAAWLGQVLAAVWLVLVVLYRFIRIDADGVSFRWLVWTRWVRWEEIEGLKVRRKRERNLLLKIQRRHGLKPLVLNLRRYRGAAQLRIIETLEAHLRMKANGRP